MAQETTKKRQFVPIRVNVPVRLDKKVADYKRFHGLKSKSVAIVKLVETNPFLFPLVNGDA